MTLASPLATPEALGAQSVLVTDTGFQDDDWAAGFTTLADAPAKGPQKALDLPSDFDPAGLEHLLGAPMIRIAFPSFADGRGFTLARRLRLLGYTGRLRAFGPVIADQYAMARRSGFDEVQIPAALAVRQPQDQWRDRADWKAHDHQSRLRGV